jgi:hypothetical protein
MNDLPTRYEKLMIAILTVCLILSQLAWLQG